MWSVRGSYSRRLLRDSRTNLRRAADGTECRDFLKTNLAPLESGEIAEDAQCTKRAAENIRSGENGMRMEYLVAMCRNNPQFRAAFFEFCGGQLEMPPELTAVITKYLRTDKP